VFESGYTKSRPIVSAKGRFCALTPPTRVHRIVLCITARKLTNSQTKYKKLLTYAIYDSNTLQLHVNSSQTTPYIDKVTHHQSHQLKSN